MILKNVFKDELKVHAKLFGLFISRGSYIFV